MQRELDQLRQMLSSDQVGVDAWYDSYVVDATQLMRGLMREGQVDACFGLLGVLTKPEQVRFFEAITNIQEPSLVPRLLKVLNESDLEIAEPIIDGLRCWVLTDGEREQLIGCSRRFYGRSKVLDRIVDSIAQE